MTVKQGDYFEFKAKKLGDGHFCWNPKYMAGWASKENAQRFSLRTLLKTPDGHLEMDDMSCRGPATIPLHVVGRVVRGTGDGYSAKILEVAFDYGTPDMCTKHFGIQVEEMMAVRQFSNPQEYEQLLERCKVEFTAEEAKIDALVAAKNST